MILAVRDANKRPAFQVDGVISWPGIKKPFVMALLAGLYPGLYITIRAGGLLMAFVIVIYFMVQVVINHLKGLSVVYLSWVAVPVFVVAVLLGILFMGQGGA